MRGTPASLNGGNLRSLLATLSEPRSSRVIARVPVLRTGFFRTVVYDAPGTGFLSCAVLPTFLSETVVTEGPGLWFHVFLCMLPC